MYNGEEYSSIAYFLNVIPEEEEDEELEDLGEEDEDGGGAFLI